MPSAPASALKVLLDENLPHNLRHSLIGHDVMSVDYMGSSGERNGELLTMCEAEGFDVLLTGDQNLPYQQIVADRRIAVVILDTLDLNALRKFARKIVDAIDRATPGSCQVVESSSGQFGDTTPKSRKRGKPTTKIPSAHGSSRNLSAFMKQRAVSVSLRKPLPPCAVISEAFRPERPVA
jgi:hypothetical protein